MSILSGVNMIKRLSDIWRRKNLMYLKYTVFTGVSLILSNLSYAAVTKTTTTPSIVLNSQMIIGSGNNYLLSGIVLILFVISLIVLLILLKLKNENKVLLEKEQRDTG